MASLPAKIFTKYGGLPLGWGTPTLLSKPVNTTDHDAATAISADGQTLYIYRDNNNGDIFETKRNGKTWSKPKALPEPINSGEYEPSFFIVNDNQFAFFASDREGGFGGLDLYLTMKQPDGTWSEALNLGTNVNTEYDEDAPFVSAEGVLYFSSRGHNSMGGFDIFSSTAAGIAWTAARNLGYPINTPFDDVYFAGALNGRQAFFSSDRAGGFGEKDIYEATFRLDIATDSLLAAVAADTVLRSEANQAPFPVVKNEKQVVATGQISDATSTIPLGAQLVFKPKNGKLPVVKVYADSISGNYAVTLQKEVAYNLEVRHEGYFYVSEDINIPLAYLADSLEKNISLKRIKAGEKIVLRNIFFEYGKDVLTKSSRQELDRLHSLLTENPKIKVEISGHTDSKGKPAYNQALSLKRARAVVSYLVKKGVNKTRMTAVGYGSRKPIASNRFEEGRKQNRRTEFKVLTQ
jgi:outer membrane protein OmpA-like peptidoglycan-associated protein